MPVVTYSNQSDWCRGFDFSHVKCLIVCRGPIRKETIEIFKELGTQPSGILLSEKDSIVYPQTLAPELRMMDGNKANVHHIPDYMGATKEEKQATIQIMINLCHEFGYTHIFAGYGFMAEDAEFIEAIEKANIGFIGPNSKVVRQAGAKDEAKQLARTLDVSVTPGVDNLTALTLLKKADGSAETFLQNLIKEYSLEVSEKDLNTNVERQAEMVLQASYSKQLDLITIPELQAEATAQVDQIFQKHPGKRIRLKYIGGGGGKGQRIVSKAEQVADAVMEVLIESKVTGVGNNRNILIELNIEDTRHNEIQLLGNGEWSIALGGRDCSLQMHEQKLLEISLTSELLEDAIQESKAAGNNEAAKVLETDLDVLKRMCHESEVFAEAVHLDSASTFECIVEGDSHYFMEMNTRIQVEHRVTEMAYSLKFQNPDNPKDYFVLESLVGAMLFIACYGKQLPKPEKVQRHLSGAEVRINASNAALKPHAGGILKYWSAPTDMELRDDQGIGIVNPDTGLFQAYHLAGAYDSNVALSVCFGKSREHNLEVLAEILRTMEIRGSDLQLNVPFHYGLIYWLLGQHAMAKPNTRFVQSYLAAVGELFSYAQQLNLDLAWKQHLKQAKAQNDASLLSVLQQKQTLLLRPLKQLLQNPHYLTGWVSFHHEQSWSYDGKTFVWHQNPLELLEQLYTYLRLDTRSGVAAAEQIWDTDAQLLSKGLEFYQDLKEALGQPELPWVELQGILSQSEAPKSKFSKSLWQHIQASHQGFQAGLEILKLPFAAAQSSGFYNIRIKSDLSIEMPEKYQDAEQIEQWTTILAPPPMASSNEILSWTGGTFYSKETPEAEPYVSEGDHFEEGQVLGILEVMKMFNPIHAEFAGTIKRILIDGSNGAVVSRGQILFEVEPDVPLQAESDAEIQQREKQMTQALLDLF